MIKQITPLPAGWTAKITEVVLPGGKPEGAYTCIRFAVIPALRHSINEDGVDVIDSLIVDNDYDDCFIGLSEYLEHLKAQKFVAQVYAEILFNGALAVSSPVEKKYTPNKYDIEKVADKFKATEARITARKAIKQV
jgi:hypothetical protein